MGFVLNYLRNLAAVAVGREPARALLVSFWITQRCSLACAYCNDGDGRLFGLERADELPTAEAKRLVAILARATDTLDLTGGEPMLRDDLEDLLAWARQCGLRTVLNTKGIGLPDRPDVMRLSDVLVLGVDSLDPQRLGRIIGGDGGAARRILAALDWAVAQRRRPDGRLVLAAVAMPDMLDDVREVLHFARRQGLGFHLSPWIVGTTVHPGLVGSDAYRRLIDDVIASKRAGGRVLGVYPYLRGIRDVAPFRCHPLLMPILRPDGRLYYPCLELKRAPVSVLEAGSYGRALRAARRLGPVPRCGNRCHIFCHMALSLLQRHPLAALAELKHWRH